MSEPGSLDSKHEWTSPKRDSSRSPKVNLIHLKKGMSAWPKHCWEHGWTNVKLLICSSQKEIWCTHANETMDFFHDFLLLARKSMHTADAIGSDIWPSFPWCCNSYRMMRGLLPWVVKQKFDPYLHKGPRCSNAPCRVTERHMRSNCLVSGKSWLCCVRPMAWQKSGQLHEPDILPGWANQRSRQH